jgi:hypothetical protein
MCPQVLLEQLRCLIVIRGEDKCLDLVEVAHLKDPHHAGRFHLITVE